MRQLLDRDDSEPNYPHEEYGFSPSLLAAKNGHGVMVRMLLAAGNDDPDIRHLDNGRTLLSFAAENRDYKTLRVLLMTRIVDVNSRDKRGRTPIWWAAAKGSGATIYLVMRLGGVDVNSTDNDGRTPLMMAQKGGVKK